MSRITWKTLSALLLPTLFLWGCTNHAISGDAAPNAQHVPPMHTVKAAEPRPLPKSRYGNPSSYQVFGKTYRVLKTEKGYSKKGYASWYGTKFHGKLTSTREPYDMYAMTAASPVLPIPCFVTVKNLENGRSIIVKVNDRGPFVKNRIIDLSYVAGKKLGIDKKGTALVQVTTIDTSRHIQYAQNQKKPTAHIISKQPAIYLQAGAFSNEHHAQALEERLKLLTRKSVNVKKTTRKSKPLYRVQVGPFKNTYEQEEIRNFLINHGIQTIPTHTQLSQY